MRATKRNINSVTVELSFPELQILQEAIKKVGQDKVTVRLSYPDFQLLKQALRTLPQSDFDLREELWPETEAAKILARRPQSGAGIIQMMYLRGETDGSRAGLEKIADGTIKVPKIGACRIEELRKLLDED